MGLRREERILVGAQAALAAALSISVVASDAVAPNVATEAAALVLALAALCLGVAALWPMRRSFRIAPAPRGDAVLVQHGVYRWLRHPMYSAVVLLIAAVSLHHPSAPTLLLATLNLIFYREKARYEEGLLLAHYPDYARYRARTRGVFLVR